MLSYNETSKSRLTKEDFYLMLPVAILFDGVQIALTGILGVVGLVGPGLVLAGIINRLIWGAGWLIFFAWFSVKGVWIFSGKHSKKRFATLLAGLIPWFEIPDLTALVIMVYMETIAKRHGINVDKVVKA